MKKRAIKFRDFLRTFRGMALVAVVIAFVVVLHEVTDSNNHRNNGQATTKTVTVPLETYANDECTGVKITQIKVDNVVVAKGARSSKVDKPISVTVRGCERPRHQLRIVNFATGKLFKQTSGLTTTKQQTRKTVRTFTSPFSGWKGLAAYAGNETCYKLIDESFSTSGWKPGVDSAKVTNQLANDGRCETQALGAEFIGQ